MMTQLNIKDRLKAYGNKGDEGILKEIKQLHTRQALMPCNRNNMSYEERKKALRYLMFFMLKGIEYNSSTKGKCKCTNEIVTTGSTEGCESENDKKVSFDNVKM